jgi:hypothetical protein
MERRHRACKDSVANVKQTDQGSCKILAAQLMLPIPVGINLVDQNRPVLAAVPGKIALAVAVNIQTPDQGNVPGPVLSTRLCARSHRATKCHAEVRHLLITSEHFLTFHWQLLAQPFRATHVWITALVKPQKSMRITGQPDTGAFANPAGRLRVCAEPKRAGCAQV